MSRKMDAGEVITGSMAGCASPNFGSVTVFMFRLDQPFQLQSRKLESTGDDRLRAERFIKAVIS